MLKRILFVTVMLLFTYSLHSGNKISNSSTKNTANTVLDSNRSILTDFAKKYLGTPYRYASIDPETGFDCSGFVHFVFKKFDINVPHSSKAFNSVGAEVKPKDFKVGDVLVFYGYRNASQIGHVGIICEANGMKSKFIHSSSGKVKGVIISELSSQTYSKRFYKCVDIIGNL
jgi:cell wall-associated NlpC family hydrolase